MNDAKHVHTPPYSKLKLSLEGKLLPNVSYYQRLMGKLIYLTIIRPDIIFSIGIASQFMQYLTMEHFNLIKRILHYLLDEEKS